MKVDVASLPWLTIEEASTLLASRALSATELCDAVLARIEALNPEVQAFLSIDAEGARAAARAAEARLASGQGRALTGIPISVKDHFATRRLPTTVASALFADYRPTFDATVVERAEEAGAVILGKANMYELGSGWGTFGHFPVARNPWDPRHSPGGSSSGSAAAVATGLGFASIASDGGGSTRVPSNYCGVVGLKPTHGRISFWGSIPGTPDREDESPTFLAKSISAVGVVARTARDAAILLSTLAGHDPRDPGSADEPVDDYLACCSGDMSGLVVGVPWDYLEGAVTADNLEAFEASLAVLEEAGAHIQKMSTPPLAAEVASIWMTIAYVEMAAMYGQYLDAPSEMIGPEMRQRIERGASTSAVDYVHADRLRAALRVEFLAAMEGCDLIATPSAPGPPPSMDELRRRASDLQDIGQLARFTRPHNLTGFPAISVPDGFSRGLPLGLQLAGRPFAEGTVLRAADAYQRRTNWHTVHPPVASPSGRGGPDDARE